MKNSMPYARCSMRVKFVVTRFGLCPMRILGFLGAHASCPMLYALCGLFLLLLTGNALADSINGAFELNYSFSSFKTTDAAGNTVKTETNSYNPRFTLNFDKNIFPNLKFRGGGIFEGTSFNSETNGEKTKATFTRMRPFLDLTLTTPLYTAGVGYSRREDSINPKGAPTTTNVNEEFSGILGWRPEGFPSTELRFIRTNTFDKDHSVLDIEKDFVSLNSKYSYKGFTADYFGTFTKTKDNLIDLKVQEFLHSGRLTYGGAFFNNRVSLNTTYNISHQETRTVSEGAGFVSSQVFPFAGLSRIDDTLPPLPLALDPNPALVDGNTTASAGIDLVSDPPLVRRQIGLDFLNPAEVNQLLVWVDRELTSTIASSFSWDVFISDDNSVWTHWAGPIVGTFGPLENRFEINFPVTPPTRYIKVVTTPLLRIPLVPPNIFVTELQASIRTPASDIQGKTKRTSHIYTLDSRTRILDNPSLYYELFYFYTRVDPSGQTRYTLSNGFSANHQFSRVFSGSARVAREDGKEEDEKRVGYVYTASINATPLRALRNSLVFSGRNEDIDGESSSDYTVFLNNTAELYKGIDVNLNGGLTFAKQATGERQRGTILNIITTIVPRRDLTFNLGYTDTTTRRSGGEGDSNDHTRRVELGFLYNPFNTLTLSASLEVVAAKGEKLTTTQNYGLNWSPFPGGALQFSFFYNESIRSEDNSKSRIIVPSVRWKITKVSYLDLIFQSIKSESDTSKSDAKVISTNLKLFF
jgi:hypothetical protein